ncbi:MAG TPA: response regulator [Tepidisphaeraceae bacterium]|nr:response regulator [Tepidisphaeraceae bacterium]
MNERTILVADDESHILNVVSLKLRNAGFRVLTAADGQEAYELALAEKPVMLITDYHMPHLSGLDLCARLNAHPELAGMKKIMLSARGYNLEPADMNASGILTMLSKPFSPRQLLQTVEEHLGTAGVASAEGMQG